MNLILGLRQYDHCHSVTLSVMCEPYLSYLVTASFKQGMHLIYPSAASCITCQYILKISRNEIRLQIEYIIFILLANDSKLSS